MPIASQPDTKHHHEEPGWVYTPFHHAFVCCGKGPPQPSPGWVVSTQFLLAQQMLHFLIMTAFWWTRLTKSGSLLYQGSPALNVALQMSRKIWEERITTPDVPATLLLTQPGRLLAFVVRLGTVTPSAFSRLTWRQPPPFLVSIQASLRLQSLLPHHTLTSPRSTTGLAGGPAQLMAQDWLSSRERK